jgi:hypothetical protein
MVARRGQGALCTRHTNGQHGPPVTHRGRCGSAGPRCGWADRRGWTTARSRTCLARATAATAARPWRTAMHRASPSAQQPALRHSARVAHLLELMQARRRCGRVTHGVRCLHTANEVRRAGRSGAWARTRAGAANDGSASTTECERNLAHRCRSDWASHRRRTRARRSLPAPLALELAVADGLVLHGGHVHQSA